MADTGNAYTLQGIASYSRDASAMIEDWELIDALRGGTRVMRKMGNKYLPKRPLEDDGDYAKRLSFSTLFPALIETVKTMVGRVFARPAVPSEDVPAWIKDEILPNVDLQGRNLNSFLKDWWKEAFEYGLSHLIVDAPAVVPGTVVTLADQKSAGIRPYLIQVHPRDVLGWTTNEKGELTQCRVRTCRTESAGVFKTIEIPQIRIYELKPDGVHAVTYEKILPEQKDEDGEPKYKFMTDVALPASIKRIPLVTLYTARTNKMRAQPPLRELAYLNAKHWVLQSGHDGLVDTASVPILMINGINDDTEIVIGAKHAVKLPPNAEMKYVEHTGAAIKCGREALDALKEEMEQAGAKLLATSAGSSVAKNALQAGQEAARENSELGGMVQILEDTVADVLDLCAEWRGESDGGKVQAQANLEADFTPVESMGVVLTMRDGGLLSDATAFKEGQRRGIVDNELDWEDEKAAIAANPPLGAMPVDGIDPGTGAPIVPKKITGKTKPAPDPVPTKP